MNLAEQQKQFELSKSVYESCKLKFIGAEGFDVYNSSIPFQWKGREYIFGRIERRSEWARSRVKLFEKTGGDEWTVVPKTTDYPLEDPFISKIHGKLVLGGTHVRYTQSRIDTFYGYFYQGTDINDMYYFTTGPEFMKDIRLVEMGDGRIGVFSRPRGDEIQKQYGSESLIGFTIINDLNELTADAILGANNIDGLFDRDEWGGCNQVYWLDSGLIGIIGHKCYMKGDKDGNPMSIYMNMSFVFDPVKHEAMDLKLIGTRSCYPEGPSKVPNLVDCAFTSGIVPREDGRVDLYSGIGDCEVGRITIDYPFNGYGNIVAPK